MSSLCFYSAALLLIFQNPLLRLLGTKPEMMEDSRTYLQVLACGTVFMLISSAMGMHAGPGGGCGQGGHVWQSGGNADQYCAGSAVYPGAWMGGAGAAAATVIGNMVSTCYYISLVIAGIMTAFLIPLLVRLL